MRTTPLRLAGLVAGRLAVLKSQLAALTAEVVDRATRSVGVAVGEAVRVALRATLRRDSLPEPAPSPPPSWQPSSESFGDVPFPPRFDGDDEYASPDGAAESPPRESFADDPWDDAAACDGRGGDCSAWNHSPWNHSHWESDPTAWTDPREPASGGDWPELNPTPAAERPQYEMQPPSAVAASSKRVGWWSRTASAVVGVFTPLSRTHASILAAAAAAVATLVPPVTAAVIGAAAAILLA